MTIFTVSEREVALYTYWWATKDASGKARLYEQCPNFRGLFTSLPHNCFFLFEKINPTLWSELVNLNYSILDRSEKDADLLTKILQSLPPTDAMKAFRLMGQITTRLAIIERLTPMSKSLVTKKLAEVEIENMKKARNHPSDPNRFYCIATKEFIETLPPSAQKCSAKDCVAGAFGEPEYFRDYYFFEIARCFKHSFHLACNAPKHVCT